MKLLMLGGLMLIVVSVLMASSKRSLTDERLKYVYVYKGLGLVFFAVGAFSVVRSLLEVVPANTLDKGYLTMGGWSFAVPLILIFLVGFSRRRKIQPVPRRFINGSEGDQADNSENERTSERLGFITRIARKKLSG